MTFDLRVSLNVIGRLVSETAEWRPWWGSLTLAVAYLDSTLGKIRRSPFWTVR